MDFSSLSNPVYGVFQSISIDIKDTDGKVATIGEEGELYNVHFESGNDSLAYAGVVKDASLDNFLSRPVLAITQPWEIGGNVDINFNPFKAYIDNPFVKEKVQHFCFMRGTIHVKITCTGTMYHYGKTIMAHEPWNGSYILYVNQVSQLPYVVLDPNTATGGTLSIPFYHPYNAVTLRNYENVDESYALIRIATINPLSVMGDTTTGVSIQVYIWMTDVEFIMPTAGRLNSELEKTTVQLGSTLKEAAREAPVLGKYVRASEIAVRAAKGIASELGYSRPNKPVVETRMMPTQLSNLSNCNVFDATIKLALDAQQETFIDGSAIGLSPDDDMLLSNIFTRESYLTTVPWSNDTVSSAPMFRIGVTPCVTIPGSGGEYILTPSSQVAACFQSWRGTMTYRIEIVATPFHRGKLKVTYDPFYDYTDPTPLNDINLAFTHIIDLSETRNYEFCVGWGVARPYLQCGPLEETYFLTDPSETLIRPSQFNGVLTLSQLAPLTAGVVTSAGTFGQAFVNIYSKADDDMVFGGPISTEFRDIQIQHGTFNSTLQLADNPGGVQEPHGASNETCLNNSPKLKDSSSLSGIHFGESIRSLRQLVKRYNYTETIFADVIPGVNEVSYYTDRSPYIPLFPRETSIAPSLGGVRFGKNTTFNLFFPSFMGYKGSMRWKYIVDSTRGVSGHHQLTRSNRLEFSRGLTAIGNTSDVNNVISGWTNSLVDFAAGGTLTTTLLQPGIEAEIPYYAARKFIPITTVEVSSGTNNAIVSPLYKEYKIFLTGVQGSSFVIPIHKFVAVGDDFSFYVYKFAPVVRKYVE